MRVEIVLGTLWGDEGKGQCVNSLAKENDLVIRFSGGHQCGHTVVTGDNKHTFSQIGAGTFKRAGTYISEYCTVYPKSFLNELNFLLEHNKNFVPYVEIFLLRDYKVNPMVMVTTPYDVAYNKIISGINNHGTVGVGFGQTIERNEKHVTLYAQELKCDWVYEKKMKEISKYYQNLSNELDIDSKIRLHEMFDEEFNKWDESVKWYKEHVKMEIPYFETYDKLIFEGSQGIMLDQNIGFFPHVTRSNTTALNAMEMLFKNGLSNHFIRETIKVHYVSRAYMTRHGNGPFSDKTIELINNKTETNELNDYQGEFRVAPMEICLLEHAIAMNNTIMLRNARDIETMLHVTCCDHLTDTGDLNEFRSISVDDIDFKYRRDWW